MEIRLRSSLGAVLAACSLLCLPAPLPAVTPAPKVLVKKVLGGLNQPTFVTHAGDGRLFVLEKAGTIRLVKDGVLQVESFLDLSALVRSDGERGLLGLAFSPVYPASGRFYVYYTDLGGSNNVVRYNVSGDPDLADSGSGEILLTIPHPGFTNHNGGMLAFGPDGYLYIGTGDGGGTGDPGRNAQDTGSLLGKMLRIDAEGPPSGYDIPSDNPFKDVPGARGELWTYGLRNPWRFSFDRGTGDLYVGDVGQNSREEIDLQPAGSTGGENYGWNIIEGDRCYASRRNCTPPPNYAPPILAYNHTQGCSVTGGYVHRYPAYPGLLGSYLYADFCRGWVRAARLNGPLWESVSVFDSRGAMKIVSFGEDEAGGVYLVDIASGAILRIVSPLFTDEFAAAGPSGNWETLSGSWEVNALGRFAPGPSAANLALVAPAALGPVSAGRIEANIRFPSAGLASAEIIFSALDGSNYRSVMLAPGSVAIAQTGSLAGSVDGVKVAAAAPISRGKLIRIRVDLADSGDVRVYLKGSAVPAATYRFPLAVAGRTGLGAGASTATFDAFTVWDAYATLP